MRKVIGFRKAWPRFRNASAGRCNFGSSVTTLEAEQGRESISRQLLPSDAQSLRTSFLGQLGNGLGSGQTRAKCGSVVEFSIATSRSCGSPLQSLQCVLPASVSVLSLVPAASGPAPDLRASVLKVSRSFNPPVVSSFSDGDDHRQWRDGNVEDCASVKLPWPCGERAVLCDTEEEDVCDEAFQNGIGNGPWESLYSHVGTNVNSSQTKSRPNWKKRRSVNPETARLWSSHLNGQQRRFRPHLSGLKLFNGILNNSSLCTRCKFLVPGVAARVI